MHRVLVVAEKAADADGLAFRLGVVGFEATASAGETTLALRQLFAFKPDAIVFNCSAGDRQRELFRLLETVSDLPVVVLGAGGDEGEVVWYLDAGAADYVVRPVSPAHLSARLRVVLRHAARDIPGGTIQVGDVEVDLDRHEVRRNGRVIRLTPTEFQLLRALAERAGQPCSHRMLLERVWGDEFASCTHYLSLYMGYLRQKLEDDPKHPRLLVTHWGVGYRLREAPGKRGLQGQRRARMATS